MWYDITITEQLNDNERGDYMWSFFWVLLIGGYWIIRLLNESGTKFAYQKRDAENDVKYEGLYYAKDGFVYAREVEQLLINHPYYFNKNYNGELVGEFELIKNDLYDIFGDYIEYVSGCWWVHFYEMIADLILSKSHQIRFITFGKNPRGYERYYDNQPDRLGDTYDLCSYKNIIGLRFYKKIEENIREKYPDFTIVYHNTGKDDNIIQDKLSVYHEMSLHYLTRHRRLWDDEPLSPDTAPTPIAPPNDYWKTK